MENYLLHLLIMVGIYSILAYSLNLVTGYGGLLQFCMAAFYGIGAYAHTLLRVGGNPSYPSGTLLFFSLSSSDKFTTSKRTVSGLPSGMAKSCAMPTLNCA